MREYTLIVKGERMPVTHEVYKAYCQEYEHEKYLKDKAGIDYNSPQTPHNGFSLLRR